MADRGIEGLLVVDKPGLAVGESPAGDDLPTSHDVVQRVRRWSGQRRIGLRAAGRWPPGVLVLCLGSLRLVGIRGHDKEYQRRIGWAQ